MERREGLTIVEVAVALAIFAVILVAMGSAFISSTRSVDLIVIDSASDQQVKKSLARLRAELECSGPSVVTIVPDVATDVVTLQTPGAYTGNVTWGAIDQNGTWREGYAARYAVSNGTLVRQTLDAMGNPVPPDETLARSVDGPSAGKKGFGVTVNGTVANVILRVRKTVVNGSTTSKEYTSAVSMKNP